MSDRRDERQLAELVERIAVGDESALTALYDGTSALVFGLARRILRDEGAAEEATLDVYMQIWRSASRYDASRGKVSTWILTLARTRALDRRRRHVAAVAHEVALEPATDAPQEAGVDEPAAGALLGERRGQVQAALAHVSAAEREVLDLAFFEGRSHSDIAKFLTLPLGTVKSRIRNGMLKLERLLSPLEAGP